MNEVRWAKLQDGSLQIECSDGCTVFLRHDVVDDLVIWLLDNWQDDSGQFLRLSY
jgi:hypothetical protein